MESIGTQATAFTLPSQNQSSKRYQQILIGLGLTLMAILSCQSPSWAAEVDAVKMAQELKVSIDTIWVLIAGIFAYLYFGGIVTGTLGLVLVVLGGVFVLTSLVSFCPLYTLVGLNTCPRKEVK